MESGCKRIIVLGVDFMSENVRAVLDAAGHTDVPVYRLARESIGCSLADAAESDAYFTCGSSALDLSHISPSRLLISFQPAAPLSLPSAPSPSVLCLKPNFLSGVRLPEPTSSPFS